MFTTDRASALALLRTAATGEQLFGPAPRTTRGERAARRRYRELVAAVHPDRAPASDAAASVEATARLNRLWGEWRRPAAADAAAPHVVGSAGTWLLRRRLWVDEEIAAYATQDPAVRVELHRARGALIVPAGLRDAAERLDAAGLAAFAPLPVDRGSVEGHPWIAYRLPAGLVTLREVRERIPSGIDGRDLAWMLRRILLVLATAGRHGRITPSTVLIEPDQHGVVLTGWGGPGDDGDAIADLVDGMLRPDETRQRAWADRARGLSPADALREYDLLLAAMYGPRRFRPFALPARTSTPPDAVA